ncbi:MAG: molybdopterin molybdotransferase MoeA [Alphaproteobacteria bacterium]|nr:molybdopterin molybdotransferase MoeA [Alphaproteobacteria bacterium]MBU0795839.1 molybdopterin molybdotransferase MoeA [Alphaproteobacteria bacterium]MBU0885753.1 molybdopterin molybdotransferase MoeA [Alphaproteobacteria bacterium]MBU1814456.1 molybdopterin molybdotransferase MoeA [Alphaproteobacteria bacterium]
MAQLTDDCFAFGGRLVPIEEALGDLDRRIAPVAHVETLPLRQTRGRYLADTIVATQNVPPSDNSAVDGYAVYFDDLAAQGTTRLPVAGRVAAGHALDGPARPGTAIRIFTGAPMPSGEGDACPDTVMMQEDCTEEDGHVVIPAGIRRGANRRKTGEDVQIGVPILARGHRMRPQDIGLAAAQGLTELSVFAPLRVAVFSTGDEVRDPPAALTAGTIYDSNRHTLMALLDGMGCRVTDIGILPDDRHVITETLRQAALDHDLILTSGGVSGGEEDHVKAAVEAQGSLHFWRLAIKPGRPVALGQVGGVVFIGLPGNPVATMVTFLRIARPLIQRLSGGMPAKARLFPVTAGFDYKKKLDRREYVRVLLSRGPEGGLIATRFPRDGAGVLSSMVAADGLVELGEKVTHIEAGATVDFLPFSEVGL